LAPDALHGIQDPEQLEARRIRSQTILDSIGSLPGVPRPENDVANNTVQMSVIIRTAGWSGATSIRLPIAAVDAFSA
jgi:hypothetical protein